MLLSVAVYGPSSRLCRPTTAFPATAALLTPMHRPSVYTPSLRRSNDREVIVLALLIATKNAFRRLGMMLPVPAVLALLARVPGLGALGAWGKGGTGAGAGPSATAEDIQVGPCFLLPLLSLDRFSP